MAVVKVKVAPAVQVQPEDAANVGKSQPAWTSFAATPSAIALHLPHPLVSIDSTILLPEAYAPWTRRLAFCRWDRSSSHYCLPSRR